MEQDKYDLTKFVSRSKHRTRVLVSLRRDDSTPSELAEILGVDIAQVSRTLKELREKGLVSCVNPNAKKRRIYETTDKAEEVLHFIPVQRKDNYVNQITSLLDEEEIPYGKNVQFQGDIAKFNPDLVVFNGHEPELAIEIRSGRGLKVKGDQNIPRGFLYSLALKAHETLGENPEVKTAVAFYDLERDEVREKTIERLKKFVEKGYFDCIFFADDLDKLASDLKKGSKGN